MASVNHDSRRRLSALLITSLTILVFIVVQSHHFHDRPYRQDEAWIVHYALDNIEREGFLPHLLQVFSRLAPENVLQDVWVHLFGHVENIVRYFSTLVTVATLTLFYRLSSCLFDRRTAWLALVLLGASSMFIYYSHEARPYAILLFGVVAYQLALFRFISRPQLKRGVLVFFAAAAAAYHHIFIAFFIVSQLICCLIFVKWNRECYRRGLLLHLALLLVIGYRMLIAYSERSGTIAYNVESSWQGLRTLYDYFRPNPESLGLFLLAGGVALLAVKLANALRTDSANMQPSDLSLRAPGAAVERRMRFPGFWREGWLILSALAMVALPVLVNVAIPSLTPRNLLIVTPTLALIAAMALRQMPGFLQLLVVLFFCLPFLSQFRFYGGNAGYLELAAYIEARIEPEADRLVIVAAQPWEIIPINYYLQERTDLSLGETDIFSVSWSSPAEEALAPPSFDASNTVTGVEAADWRRLRDFLGDRERIWVIKGNPYPGGQNMLAELASEYSVYTVVDFPGKTYYRPLEILEYRRQPAAIDEPLWRFGAAFNLLDWRLNDDHIVQPCSTISVDTWWSLAQESTSLYSSTLVLVGEDGQGVSNADDVPGGAYLTSIWQPDQRYFDERELLIPCDLEDGDYSLVLGMYQLPAAAGEPVENLPVYTTAGEPAGRRYQYLTTLRVRR